MVLYLPEWWVKTLKMIGRELDTAKGGEAPIHYVIQFSDI
jgi:hypothetical protein